MKIYPLIFTLLFTCTCCSAKINEGSAGRQESNIPVISKVDTAIIDFEPGVNALKNQLTNDFIVKGHSYFIIASNMSEEETEKIIKTTIDRAVDCFYNDYFSSKPSEATTIFLFKNDETYRYWAKKLYDDDDLSRFGYYKPSEKTMLMNINTGTGTLVHEMTHALVRYDFPDIPSWFNEGLGSLYERCSLNDKTILGYVNWRLPYLQDAIADKSYKSLASLVKTDWDEFYGANSDVNYAQARYLCMYLQENGLLKKFYKSFRDTYNEDKTGRTQLEQVTGKSIDELDNVYVSWVKTLKYE